MIGVIQRSREVLRQGFNSLTQEEKSSAIIRFGRNLLFDCAEYDDLDFLKDLINAGIDYANVTITSKEDEDSILDAAVRLNAYKIVNYFLYVLNMGVSEKMTDYVFKYKAFETLEIIVDKLDSTTGGFDGSLFYNCVTMFFEERVIDLLLSKSVDIDAECNGLKAIERACKDLNSYVPKNLDEVNGVWATFRKVLYLLEHNADPDRNLEFIRNEPVFWHVVNIVCTTTDHEITFMSSVDNQTSDNVSFDVLSSRDCDYISRFILRGVDLNFLGDPYYCHLSVYRHKRYDIAMLLIANGMDVKLSGLLCDVLYNMMIHSMATEQTSREYKEVVKFYRLFMCRGIQYNLELRYDFVREFYDTVTLFELLALEIQLQSLKIEKLSSR